MPDNRDVTRAKPTLLEKDEDRAGLLDKPAAAAAPSPRKPAVMS
jgi:hypothetical protein